ncbi:MAG: acyltransferase [Ferruginibacter sp.]
MYKTNSPDTSKMNNKPIYFPGLNGLRAIAAIAVVMTHITLKLDEFGLDPFIFGMHKDGTPKGVYLGSYGVTIFFVLSGFLITYLLTEEKAQTGISVKKFYFRRILRIWPLYYLYLAVSIITILVFNLGLNRESLFFYIFYAANIPSILVTSLPLLGHYWSLGVEEQFYLFWPWVIKKIHNPVLPILTAIITLIVVKALLHFYYPDSLLESVIHITRFHCMMIGALGAIFYRQNNKLFLKIIDNKITQIAGWGVILLVAINRFHFISVIDNEVISVVSLFLIIGQINIKNRIINLEKNLFDYLGKISYGIYVIHPLLIFLFSKLFFQLNVQPFYKYFIVFFVIIATTILTAHLSFTYFEKYFMNFKKRFVLIKSSATRNPAF